MMKLRLSDSELKDLYNSFKNRCEVEIKIGGFSKIMTITQLDIEHKRDFGIPEVNTEATIYLSQLADINEDRYK